ncbi:uncharacterized protein LOC130810856 [Amaranthus tricolor]|uniref:uncharacterized protein LOC130810856 n=1 Tax=Amaranthus tricolor TaxID=29722 RepID=UPI00258A3FE8|nr:uncharacterized protein LOC130810856 [Amaranthus tricolor]
MVDLKKREFNALELTGNNYIQWASDVKLYLIGKRKGIERDPIKIEEDKAKVASIMRHHLIDSLKHEYTNYEDPKLLWEKANERFGHYKSVILPKAIDEWRELRFQDFKSIRSMPFNEINMIERNVRHRRRGNYFIRG